LESFIVQFPAGLSDREGEEEKATATPELLEETRCAARRVIPIISARLAPGEVPPLLVLPKKANTVALLENLSPQYLILKRKNY